MENFMNRRHGSHYVVAVLVVMILCTTLCGCWSTGLTYVDEIVDIPNNYHVRAVYYTTDEGDSHFKEYERYDFELNEWFPAKYRNSTKQYEWTNKAMEERERLRTQQENIEQDTGSALSNTGGAEGGGGGGPN